jgi:hypothetical protein
MYLGGSHPLRTLHWANSPTPPCASGVETDFSHFSPRLKQRLVLDKRYALTKSFCNSHWHLHLDSFDIHSMRQSHSPSLLVSSTMHNIMLCCCVEHQPLSLVASPQAFSTSRPAMACFSPLLLPSVAVLSLSSSSFSGAPSPGRMPEYASNTTLDKRRA